MSKNRHIKRKKQLKKRGRNKAHTRTKKTQQELHDENINVGTSPPSGNTDQSHFVTCTITREPKPSKLNDSQKERFAEALNYLKLPLSKNLEKARSILETLIQENPKEAPLYSNLASVLGMQGHPEEESAALIKKAIEVNPDYILGYCNLASIHIHQNEFDEARELLKPLYRRKEFHFQEFMALMGLQAVLLASEKNFEAAFAMIEKLKSMLQDETDMIEKRQLKQQEKLVKKYEKRASGSFISRQFKKMFGKNNEGKAF